MLWNNVGNYFLKDYLRPLYSLALLSDILYKAHNFETRLYFLVYYFVNSGELAKILKQVIYKPYAKMVEILNFFCLHSN